MPKTQKIIYLFLFAIIISLSIYLRFYKLSQADFISGDEYIYYSGADIGMTLRDLFLNFSAILRGGQIGSYISKLIKHMPIFAKPGYNFLAAIATFIMGESIQRYKNEISR